MAMLGRIGDLEMSNITASPTFSTIPQSQLPQYLDKFAKDVVNTVNGNLDFSNFNFRLMTVNFSTANVSQVFTHSLGRVPVGYIPYGFTFSGYVYDGTSKNTATQIYLRSSGVGTVRMIIF